MSEELSTNFKKNEETTVQEQQEWGGEEDQNKKMFIRSFSSSHTPNRLDSLSYSEEEYESDDPNDLDYIPCYYRFCDEPSENVCDDCELDLCIDHTYVKYDDEYHYCTFCLTNRFDKRLTNVKNDVKKVKKIVKELNIKAKDINSDISCIYFTSFVGAAAFIVYSFYTTYLPNLV